MNIAIVGLGLIGGSMGLALRKKGHQVAGVDQNADNQSRALELGLIEQVWRDQMPVDVLILAIPVQYLEAGLPEWLEKMPSEVTIMDMGSTKGPICEAVKYHPGRGRFLAAHPIAGTEFSGPEAAFESLFTGRTMILCETEKTDADALQVGKSLIDDLEMEIHEMTAASHDFHLALVSHLSHITSFSLGQTALQFSEDTEDVVPLAGSGFASTVRLAKSSPEMWMPVFLQNREHLLSLMDAYTDELSKMKQLIKAGDAQGLLDYLRDANAVRRLLD